MRKIVLLILTTIFLTNCRESETEYASRWTREIKEKIIEDVNQRPDSSFLDTVNNHLTFFKGDRKLKYYMLRTQIDKVTKKNISVDTLVSIFYSNDQNFELIRELCPAIERSFEGVAYKGRGLGLAEFRFCDGKLKEQGYRFDGVVGIWKEWDENGNVIKETDNGKTEKLEELKNIKYER